MTLNKLLLLFQAMLRLLLSLGTLALAVAVGAHSVVPTARGVVPTERVAILPGKGGIKSYKAVPEGGQPESDDVPGLSRVTIRPVAVTEEEYPEDEDGTISFEVLGGEVQSGEEGSGNDDKIPAVNEQDEKDDTKTQEPEVSMSAQEDTKMGTKQRQKDSPRSDAFCLVSGKKPGCKGD